MELPFLDRHEETARLQRFCRRSQTSLAVLYGRRRCGKSRLLLEALPPEKSIYYLADEREAPLQRAALAQEIARHLGSFADVIYPDWNPLIERWFAEAAPQSVLVLDEFPALVGQARELPSILQRHLDRRPTRGCHLALCGSSQRVMQGLVLDRTAPLFGRAVEILKVRTLLAGWTVDALQFGDAIKTIEAYSFWGGVPRYWELAADYANTDEALRDLVLNPLGVLHNEPDALLLDELSETAQSASILQLIGQGCHRLSEIAARLGKPATSLVRPLQRLVELELVARDRPFGSHERDSKRTFYRLSDPFLRFWFRHVGPRRSLLQARQVQRVYRQLQPEMAQHCGSVWEDLARESVVVSDLCGQEWNPAQRWWGSGTDGKPLEIDLVAESVDGRNLLLGSVKWERTRVERLAQELQLQAQRFPLTGNRNVHLALWLKYPARASLPVVSPQNVLDWLR